MANKTSNRGKNEATSNKTNNPKSNPKRNGYKARGKQSNKSGGKTQVEKDIERGSRASSRNDISDFSRNPELLKASASLPFASILGRPISNNGAAASVPGIMAIHWSPTIGADARAAAVNQSATSMYSFLVHANSRNYSYTAADLMMVTLAGGEVFSALATAQRAYGIVKNYAERNLYYPDALLQALGFEAADMRRNQGRIWFDINDLINQTKQIWVPQTLPFLKRHYEMNSHVYTDSPNVASQIYVYVQDRYWEFRETWATTGTSLTAAHIPTVATEDEIDWTYATGWAPFSAHGTSGGVKWWQFRAMIQRMINLLLASEDRGIMYGDLLNAYGQDKIYALGPVDSLYSVMPEYNAEILTQVENMTTTEMYISDVVQKEEQIMPVWFNNPNATVGALASTVPNEQVINFHFPGQPSPEAVIVATRLKVGSMIYAKTCTLKKETTIDPISHEKNVTPELTNTENIIPSTVGTEVVNSIYLTRSGTAAGTWDIGRIDQYPGSTVNVNQLKLMAFDWHPFVYSNAQNTVDADKHAIYTPLVNVYGDFDNYIAVNDGMLGKMNDVCIYSLFGVPQV